MSKEAEKPPRITKIWAENFRSIEKLELELSPLTVLVGPNAAGKSNIADIPVFISDALRNGLDNALSVRGRLSTQRGRDSVIAGATMETDEARVDYDFSVRLSNHGEHKVRRETVSVMHESEPLTQTAIEVKDGRLTQPPSSHIRKDMRRLFASMDRSVRSEVLKIDPLNLGLPFSTIASLLVDWRRIAEHSGPGFSWDDEWLNFRKAADAAVEQLKEVRRYHIFPNILRNPCLHSANQPLVEDGGNLASVIQEMRKGYPEDFGELLTGLTKIVPSITDVNVKPFGRHLTLNFTHKGAGSGKAMTLDAFHESDGTLRLLGLLTALYQKPAPSLSIIEEPELAIHPGAMAYIAELMEETAHLRMPTLITTHSPDFLDLVPTECIRAVEPGEGGTIAAPIAVHQRDALAKKLFTPGELHRMEGLQISRKYV